MPITIHQAKYLAHTLALRDPDVTVMDRSMMSSSSTSSTPATTRNHADRRVHQLLTEKFKLFDEVFGASDEVLGTIESGVDFEKRVLAIYQTCRNPEQIEAAFNQLQDDLKEQIEAHLADTRRTLLENFDEDVHERLRLELAPLTFDLDAHPTKIYQLEPLRGKSGYLRLHQLTIESFETENFLLLTAHLEANGQPAASLDPETAEKLLNCTCVATQPATIPQSHTDRLDAESQRHREATLSQSIERNNRHFRQATEQIDRWADDKIRAAEEKLVQIKAEIRALRNQARQATTLEEQHRLQEDIRLAEKRKRKARRDIDDIEDEIENQRDQLIASLESRLTQGQTHQTHFSIRFQIKA